MLSSDWLMKGVFFTNSSFFSAFPPLPELLGFLLSTNARVKTMTDDSVSHYIWNPWNVYISNSFAWFFFACCMLKQNHDLFYFRVCSGNTLLWKDFSCFRRLIKVLKIKWSRWSEALNLLACHCLLAVKYSAELSKYILLSAREIFRLSTGIFRKYPSQTWYICLITPNII